MEKVSRRQFLAGLGVTAGALGLSTLTACNQNHHAIDLAHGNDMKLFPKYDGKQYVKKDFSHLIGKENLGLSAAIIENHIGLYNKYVDKVNQAELSMSENKINETSLKELAFSLNGMALHDIYFSNMTTETTKRSKALDKAFETTFGSFDDYFKNLLGIASEVKGWSITGVNLLNGKIFNYGEDTHSSNFPIYFMPILALDVYEHAYDKDFGLTGKSQYLEAFSKIIDWDLVSKRFDAIKMTFH